MAENEDNMTHTKLDDDPNFEYVCQLGEGTNGVCHVLKEEKEENGRKIVNFYALKKYRTQPSSEKKTREEIENLVKIKDHLSYKIVKTYKDYKDYSFWILMDFIPGITLARMTYNQELPPWFVFWVSWSLSETVATLHESNIIHRDIKPENIVVDCSFFPHLLDYDEATEVNKDGYRPNSTGQHGTILYAAPEVFSGHPYRCETDVYSIAGTIFALVTGKAPFMDFFNKTDPKLSFDFLTLSEKDNLKNHLNESIKSWRETVNPILQDKIKEGLTDQSYSPETDNYKNLPIYYQELISIIFDCWNKKAEERPKAKQVADRIMNASKNLDDFNMDMFLAYTELFKKQCFNKDNHGSIENVKNTFSKFGCINMKNLVNFVFKDDKKFDSENVEKNFINTISKISFA